MNADDLYSILEDLEIWFLYLSIPQNPKSENHSQVEKGPFKGLYYSHIFSIINFFEHTPRKPEPEA